MFDESMKTMVAAAIADRILSTQSESETDRMFEIGEKVLIRTVTFTAIGRVVKENSLAVWLDDACFVASTGRFSQALRTGELDELETCPGTRRIAIGGIVDVDQWTHELPSETK